ncbi:MAG: phosphate ABC transporter substrate-binding protein [Candidatus Binatia bacterium]|nr:phosphate ABC transporter substrate-binding protein [Candidatus Binatia bacterium]
MQSILWLCLLSLCSAVVRAEEAVKVDPALPVYERVSGVSGTLNSVGSDTMNNLMTLWAEGFAKIYPNVKVQVEGKGSSTAPAALIARTAQLGPMSRPMKDTERDQFEAKFGYKPTEIRTAVDAVAVYVHKDNPLAALTLPQVDAIFSKTRRLGYPHSIDSWGQLGLKGAWENRRISMYGRNSASGTYGFFKEHALGGGDFKDEVKEQPGSASVVQGVSEDAAGVGYSGIGYRTSGVKALALSPKEGAPAVEPVAGNVYNGTYPLARFLFVYINKEPGKPLDPLVREFLKFVLSKEGQEIVVKDGYLPLPAKVVKEERAKLE